MNYNAMVTLQHVQEAKNKLEGVAYKTPLMKSLNLSDRFASKILLKREDLQLVRSYKLRGAYNKMCNLSEEQKQNGIVCASAGNHAQGVAYSCMVLGIQGTIYMPSTTPKQKIRQVELFGKSKVKIVLAGDTFDDAYQEAVIYGKANNMTFIHPFDDPMVIAGQGTVALEVLADAEEPIDYLFVPIGGGGLAAGVCTVFKELSPNTIIIGVEPEGAPSMKTSIEKGVVTTLDHIDKFVDGAAVKRAGDLNFEICKDVLNQVITIPEGKVCTTILSLYNEEAMVVEPAGALTISALDFFKEEIKGKNVVCIVSGSNNDITRTEEIKERSLVYEGLKHYFMIQFPQRPGALKAFVNEVLGQEDDITYFQFSKKNSRESGPVVVGIELKNKEDFQGICDRLNALNFTFEYLNNNPTLFGLLVG
jgi:threonine dehydratase